MSERYTVSAEWVSDMACIVRLHEAPAVGHGDAYIWACVLIHDGETAVIKGAVAAPPLAAMPALHAALREAGYRYRVHERIKDGKVRLVTRSL